MKYNYPAIFTPAEESGYYVQFCDAENWFTEGETFEEAMLMAEDALNLMLWGAEKDGDDIPTPTPIEEVKLNEGEIVKMIHADTEAYAKKMEEYKAIEADSIKAASERAGLSMKQLVELIGAPYRTVQNWNSGRHNPPLWLQKLIIEKIESSTVAQN